MEASLSANGQPATTSANITSTAPVPTNSKLSNKNHKNVSLVPIPINSGPSDNNDWKVPANDNHLNFTTPATNHSGSTTASTDYTPASTEPEPYANSEEEVPDYDYNPYIGSYEDEYYDDSEVPPNNDIFSTMVFNYFLNLPKRRKDWYINSIIPRLKKLIYMLTRPSKRRLRKRVPWKRKKIPRRKKFKKPKMPFKTRFKKRKTPSRRKFKKRKIPTRIKFKKLNTITPNNGYASKNILGHITQKSRIQQIKSRSRWPIFSIIKDTIKRWLPTWDKICDPKYRELLRLLLKF